MPEHAGAELPLRHPGQHARRQPERAPGLAVGAQRQLVVGAAGNEVIRHLRQLRAGLPFQFVQIEYWLHRKLPVFERF